MNKLYKTVVTTVSVFCGCCEEGLISSTDNESTLLCEGEFCYCNNPDCKQYKKEVLVNDLANHVFPITQETIATHIKFKKENRK